MQRVVLDGVEPGSVVRAVDARTYARGVLFAQRRAVAEMEWDGEHNALYTEVHDSGTVHEAVAYFRVRRARLDFVFGECTCPAGMNCVHVVASVLAAADTAGVGRTGTAGAHPPWERTLRSLFAPDPPSLNDLREPVPLAVELSLSAGHSRSVALSARVVRPGRTGWVGGGMSWRNVASHYSLGDCAPAHVRVLRELYALHSAGSGPSRYHYGGYDRTIDLAGVGRGLWSVLDEAADVGLQIVHARKRFGTVDRYGSAELCLDVTAGPAAEALEIAPALRFDAAEETDADALPILFLGAEGHGVVHVSRAQARVDPDPAHWRFRLARLATPAPPPLRRLVLEGGISVPADQRARFLDEFYPRLRRLAPVASSDASFTPPAVSCPSWCSMPPTATGTRSPCGGSGPTRWAERGSASRSRPRPRDEAVRDPAHERAALDALDLPPFATGLLRADGPGSALLPQVRLDGLDTMRFSTEVLPLLADADGVVVEVDGSPAVYRETGDLLQVGVSTTGVGRGHRLVRPGHPDQRRGPRRAVRRRLRRPRRRRVAPAPAGRGVLLAAQARAAGAAHAHRGGPGAAGLAVGPAAAQPLPGRAVGRAGRARRRRRPGARLAAAGHGPAGGRRAGSDAGPRRSARTAAALPARRVSTGCASCGGTGSAACSPTTWGWARRCRRSP